MDSAVIFYFSGTGNTRSCAHLLGIAMAARGIRTIVCSIENTDARALAASFSPEGTHVHSLPVFAYPVYGSDIPGSMKDFLREVFPSSDTVRVAAAFCTQLAFSGDGAAICREELLPKGWQLRWTAHVFMPNNICISAIRIPYTNDPARLERTLRRAGKKLGALAAAIASGRPYGQGKGAFSFLLGLIQRAPFRKVEPALRNGFGVFREECTGCGLCADLCPSGNLSISDGFPLGAGRCALCMRCYDFCPQAAVTFFGKPHRASRGIPYRGPFQGFDPRCLKESSREYGPDQTDI